MYENLLKDLKKSNQKRKLVLAKRAGYETVEEYKKFLEDTLNGTAVTPKDKVVKPTTRKTKKSKPTIHIVDILDRSTSMSGPKISAANKGINEGVKALKESKEDVDYTYSLCYFGSRHDVKLEYLIEGINKVRDNIQIRTAGCTALYVAVLDTYNKVLEKVGKKDKVLINIYTDGGDNESSSKELEKLKNIIKNSGKTNFTFTFIGTEHDVYRMQMNLKLDDSNTLVYNNTGEGLKEALDKTIESRSVYSSKVVKGEDVSTGFYKTIVKK